jgi:dynein heavy chain 1, cytosolic
MIWFSEEVVTTEMMFENFLARLRNLPLDSETSNSFDEILSNMNNSSVDVVSSSVDMNSSTTGMPQKTIERASRSLDIQLQCSQALSLHFASDGLVPTALNYALTNVDHVMEANKQRLLFAFFSMMNHSIRKLINYDSNHRDFPIAVKF